MALGVRGDPDEHLPSETVTDKARRLVRAEFDLMRDFLKYHAVSDEDVAKLLVIGGRKQQNEKRYMVYRKIASLIGWPEKARFPMKAAYPKDDPAN
eukprot:jgi/Tetstr1/465573/TSEL_000133.t2